MANNSDIQRRVEKKDYIIVLSLSKMLLNNCSFFDYKLWVIGSMSFLTDILYGYSQSLFDLK